MHFCKYIYLCNLMHIHKHTYIHTKILLQIKWGGGYTDFITIKRCIWHPKWEAFELYRIGDCETENHGQLYRIGLGTWKTSTHFKYKHYRIVGHKVFSSCCFSAGFGLQNLTTLETGPLTTYSCMKVTTTLKYSNMVIGQSHLHWFYRTPISIILHRIDQYGSVRCE